MGWSYSREWESKPDVACHYDVPISFIDKFAILEHKMTSGALVVLAKHVTGVLEGDVFVTVFLLSKDDGEWGYKSLGDSCGPCHYDVPISFIDKTIASGRDIDAMTLEWHENIRQYHKQKSQAQKRASALSKGTCVKYCGVVYELVSKLSSRLGWEVISKADNCRYRLMAKQVRDAQVVST